MCDKDNEEYHTGHYKNNIGHKWDKDSEINILWIHCHILWGFRWRLVKEFMDCHGVYGWGWSWEDNWKCEVI